MREDKMRRSPSPRMREDKMRRSPSPRMREDKMRRSPSPRLRVDKMRRSPSPRLREDMKKYDPHVNRLNIQDEMDFPKERNEKTNVVDKEKRKKEAMQMMQAIIRQ